jgi:CRP-like cAMP-binding protein
VGVAGNRRRKRDTAFALQRRCDDRKNRLLACLPDEEFEILKPHLQLVQLSEGQVLFESGERPAHVFFPIDAVVSLLYITVEGHSSETANVGASGLVGIGLFMGGDATPNRALVQCTGTAYRLPAAVLKEAFERGGALQHLLLRYSQALITQMSQIAACNRHHTVYQQVCRWLLRRLELVPGQEVAVTQEAIALALGVRRESVTEAELRLSREHAIEYSRGRILVVDKAMLLNGACECHTVVKSEYDRLLPWKLAT